MADAKGSTFPNITAPVTGGFLLGYDGVGSKRFPVTAFALASELAALTTTVGGKASTTALNTEKARIDALLAGANGSLDTFLELYNRFVSEDSEQAAFLVTLNGKLTTPASPADGKVLGYASGAPAWVSPAASAAQVTYSRGKVIREFTDFTVPFTSISTTVDIQDFQAISAGAGTVAWFANFLTESSGAVRLTRVASGATGIAAVAFNKAGHFYNGKTRFTASISIDTVSDATNRFEVHALAIALQQAFSAGQTSGAGMWFEYSDNLNSGKWWACCRNASGITRIDTGVLVAAATRYTLAAEINQAGTEITFYINGALVATATSNLLPFDGSVQYISVVEIMGVSGPLARVVRVDFHEILAKFDRGTPSVDF